MKTMIEIRNLTKDFIPSISFGQLFKLNLKRSAPTRALEDVSFSLGQGKILGVLGANGAGKTTLLKILATLILPDKGEVIVGGFTVGKSDEKIKSIIGLVTTEERSFYWRLTGMENLEFFAALYGLNANETKSRIRNLLKLFKIDYENKRFDFYSTGMKRKFAFIRALLHNPEILFLDEPTKSLDYNSSLEFRKFIKQKAQNGRTVIFATHNMEEAETLCDLLIVLHEGKVCGFGSHEELKRKTSSPDASLAEVYFKLIQNA